MICRPSVVRSIQAAKTRWLRVACVLSAAALFCLPGCSTEDPLLQSLREKSVLRAEPTAPTTITDAKARLSENPNVEFVGRIAADESAAFTPGKATFVVTEILPGESGHGGKHHADNCPFCKRKAAEAPRAAVQFVDAQGEALAVDARKLFGIGAGDTVVVRGSGQLVKKLELFIVTADGVYLRRSGGGQ